MIEDLDKKTFYYSSSEMYLVRHYKRIYNLFFIAGLASVILLFISSLGVILTSQSIYCNSIKSLMFIFALLGIWINPSYGLGLRSDIIHKGVKNSAVERF